MELRSEIHYMTPPPAPPGVRNRLATARHFASVCRFSNLRLSAVCLRGIDGQCVVSRSFFDRNLYLDIGRGNPQCMLYLQGERFIEERHIIKNLIEPGITAIDVGANIGYYTLMIASYVGRDGSVLCIEPDPDNLVDLRRNVELNQMSNVRIVAAAAAQFEGTAGLVRGINAHVVEQPEGEMLIKALPVDSLDIRSAGFMKIDVEGYELPVLLGAQRVIEKHRPNLFVEVHPQFQKDPAETGEVLRFVAEYYRNVVIWTRPRGSRFKEMLVHYWGASPFKSSSLTDHEPPSDIFWVTAQVNT
jgi:FkbM family methyltransferase